MSQIGKNDFDNLLLFLWSKKTLIIRVTLVGFILGIVVAFLIPPTYKSESTFFVPSSASLSRVFIGVMPSTPASGDNLMGFSDDAPVEFYLQMLESRRMRDVLNQSLHLDQVFGIAKDHPNYDFVLQKQFQEYFNFSRTPNNAIKISTYFSNPETAQAMNEAVLKSINTVRNEVVKERGIAALNHIDRELDSLETVVVSYSERLKPYHDKGIFDYKLQTDRLTQGYATALANGGNKQALEEQFKILGEDGAAFESLYSDFKAVLEVKALLQQRKIEIKTEMGQLLEHKFVIDHANKPDKKDSPKRSIVILLATLSSFLLILVALLFNEKLKTLSKYQNEVA